MKPQQKFADAARKPLAARAQMLFAKSEERLAELTRQRDEALVEGIEALGACYGRRLKVTVEGRTVHVQSNEPRPVAFGTELGQALGCFGALTQGERVPSRLHQNPSLAASCSMPLEAAEFMVYEHAFKLLQEAFAAKAA